MLEVEHIKFAYKHNFPVLEDVSFTADKGEIICLLGPNGKVKRPV